MAVITPPKKIGVTNAAGVTAEDVVTNVTTSSAPPQAPPPPVYATPNATAYTVKPKNIPKVTAAQADMTDPIVAGQATASTADAITRTITPDELSATHLDRMLASDSAPMRRARNEGLLTAGARGLQNSSLAAGHAMGAMVDRATPFALQGAEANVRTASENMAARNTAALENARLLTNTSIANAGFTTEANVATGRNTTDVNVANAGLATNARITNANNRTTTLNQNAGRRTDVSVVNTNNAVTANRDKFMFDGQAFLQNDAQAQQVLMARIGANLEAWLAGIDQEHKIEFQNLLGEQAKGLLEIENENKLLLQSSASAASLYSSYMDTVAAIMGNHEISPEAAKTKLTVAGQTLQSGLELIAEVGRIDLSDFKGTTAGGEDYDFSGLLPGQGNRQGGG